MLFAHLAVQGEVSHSKRALIHQPTHFPLLSPALPRTRLAQGSSKLALQGVMVGRGSEEKMGVKL